MKKLFYKISMQILILSLTIFLNINFAMAENVISFKNNLNSVEYVKEDTFFVISFLSGKQSLTKIEDYDKKDISKISLNESNKELNANDFVKISSLVDNFNNSLTKVPIYDDKNTIYLNKNEKVKLLEKVENFFKVLYNDKEFYINEEDIILKEDKKTYAIVKASSGLNLRKEPNTNSEILGVLSLNEKAEVIKIQDNWAEVETKIGQKGYLSLEFVEISLEKSEQDLSDAPEKAKNLIEFAKQFLGKPYVFGGTNLETGTDCSGFTYSIFKNFNITLGRTAQEQFLNGIAVDKEDLSYGDLVFFSSGGVSGISHIGIYIGNGEYIHSSDETYGVIISSMLNPFSVKYYFGARRVL